MKEERQRVLEMLAEGKISVSEAERLLDALGTQSEGPVPETGMPMTNKRLKYLRVEVEPTGGGNGKEDRVNVRIPLQLIRAGVKLGSVFPKHLKDKVNDALKDKGFEFDVSSLDLETLDELLKPLSESSIYVDKDNRKIRIFCE